MDKFKIDSHKLMYHPERISAWLNKKLIYPIYLEVSPSGSCNHRCVYCALDFMEYQHRFIDAGIFKQRLREMGRLGVKSIMYAGEGEPFLHRDIVEIIHNTKKSGIDAAITTNGALFTKELTQEILSNTTWIKVSINAATPKTYAKIHRTNPADFKKVIKNMSYAANLRKKKGYRCTLGMQIILLPENFNEVELLAKKAKKIGMDYLVVKPYSQHPQSITRRFENIKYNQYFNLAKKLERINGKRFNVIFRLNTMCKWDEKERTYKHCLALPFWAYIDAGGDVWVKCAASDAGK